MSGVGLMRLRNNSGTWSEWITVPSSGTYAEWDLATGDSGLSNGLNTVSVLFKDAAGNEMLPANAGSDTIVCSIASLNRPPTAGNLYITPDNPKSGQALAGHYDYSDLDGDPEGATMIAWYLDSEQYATNTLTIPSSVVVSDQQWYFEVTPHDGYQEGATVRSPKITIGSIAPSISDAAVTLGQSTNYTLNLDSLTSDADNTHESLSYAIVNNPPAGLGASIVGHNLQISPNGSFYGTSTVTVQVSDGESVSSNNVIVTVDAILWLTNSPPASYAVDEDQRLEVDLWPYFHDNEDDDHDLWFEVTDSRDEVHPLISQGRFLVVSADADWPTTDAGNQSTPVAVKATDLRGQSVSWTPSVEYQPVNDPPLWTGQVVDVSMPDTELTAIAQVSVGSTSLRSIADDPDTDLSSVQPDSDLFSLSSTETGLTPALEGDGVRVTRDFDWRGSATVTVTANDRDTRAAPNNQTADTTFKVTVTDDDDTPPEISNISVTMTNGSAPAPTVGAEIRVVEEEGFHISCDITDTQSGVYDDDTGGGTNQGVFVLWDNDGRLHNGGESIVQMSLLSGNQYRTDSPIPGQSGTVANAFVYQICAWDNDFDHGAKADRAMGSTGVRSDIVINDLPEVLAIPPASEQQLDANLVFSLTDINSDPLSARIRFYHPVSNTWYAANVLGCVSNIVNYGIRTNIWRSAYRDSAGEWTGDLPNLDIGDPRSEHTNLCQVSFQAFDGHHWGPVTNIAFHLDNNIPPAITLNAPRSEYKAQGTELPEFSYRIEDPEKDVLSMTVEHRWASSTSWIPSTISSDGSTWLEGEVTNISEAAYTDSFQWDAVADAVRDGVVPDTPCDLTNARIRLVPADLDDCPAPPTPEFSVDLFPEPLIAMMGDPTVSDTGMVRSLEQVYRIDPGYVRHVDGANIWYSDVAGRDLKSGAANPVGPTVTMQYGFMLPGDTNVFPVEASELAGANLSSKTYSQYQNQDIDISWLFNIAGNSLPRENVAGMSFQIRAANDEPGEFQGTSPADVDNNMSPEVPALALAAEGNTVLSNGYYRGDVLFDLTVSDFEDDPVSLRFQYSTNGVQWADATVYSPADWIAVVPGPYTVSWCSRADLPLQMHTGIWFRVAADDTSSGEWSATASPFGLDNRNQSPSVTILDITGTSAVPTGSFTVRYLVEDANDDTTHILSFAYSTNGGSEWVSVPTTDLVGDLLSPPGTNEVIWDTQAGAASFDGIHATNLSIRLSVDDGTPFVSEAHDSGHANTHAIAWDGNELWTFDFTADRGYRHDLTATGWPEKDSGGNGLGFDYPEESDCSGRSSSPWLLLPEPQNNRSYVVNLNWNGSAFGSPQFKIMNTVAQGLGLATGSTGYVSSTNTSAILEINTSGSPVSFGTIRDLTGESEMSLAWQSADGPEDGLWTLERGAGNIRQYAWDTNTLEWSYVRYLDSGIPGLTGIDFKDGVLWSVDGTSNRLIRTDGISASLFACSDAVTVDNRLSNQIPVVSNVTAVATNVPSTNDLVIAVSAGDPDGDSISTSIWWTVNGVHRQEFDNSTLIAASNTVAGDIWQPFVVVSDGRRTSPQAAGPEIHILNCEPVEGTLSACPLSAFTDDSLAVIGWPTDPDGYPLHVSYSWTSNGVFYANSNACLPYWATAVGDGWTCTVTAVDSGNLTGRFDLAWTIANHLPEMEEIGDRTVQEADWVWFRVEATDAEGHSLDYGLSYDPNNTPGLLMWHAEAHTFFWYPTYDAAGEYDFTFTAHDLGPGGGIASQTVHITVLETERPPYLYIGRDVPVQEGQEIDLLAGMSGGDLDETNTVVALEVLRQLGVTFHFEGWQEGSWTTNGTYQTTYEDSGLHQVDVFAFDSSGATSSPYTVYVSVTNMNRAPSLSDPSDREVTEGQHMSFTITGDDPDNNNAVTNDDNTLSLFWDVPAGAVVTNSASNTWSFSWTPGFDAAGSHQAYFELTDHGVPELTATQVITITVTDVSSADTDGDGLEDDWERSQFGDLTPDGSGDRDKDGFTDKEEHDAGTDPNWDGEIPAVITRAYSLTSGWNTVVIDVTTSNMTLGSLFAEVTGSVSRVMGWDADGQDWFRWDVHSSDLGTVDGTKLIQCRQGLNVEATQNCVLSVSGTTSNQAVALGEGWNYTGILGFSSQVTTNVTVFISGACALLTDGDSRYDLETNEIDSSITNVTPRQAYWLKMNDDTIWPRGD